jgi:sugar phosphate isomerase/epimerase
VSCVYKGTDLENGNPALAGKFAVMNDHEDGLPIFGLKLGLHEAKLAVAAREIWDGGVYGFLELYVPLDADPEDASHWAWFDGPLVLHAPHAFGGFNFASRELAAGNSRCLAKLDELHRRMRPKFMVFHPGLDGEKGEMFRQIGELAKNHPDLHRLMLIENKPRLGLRGEICLGASPGEMREILSGTGCGFCLDVRHALAYAAWAGLDWCGVVRDFAAISPRLWHAADGRMADRTDSHLHIGDGDLPWAQIGAFWSHDAMVTLECAKEPSLCLSDFSADLTRLKACLKGE